MVCLQAACPFRVFVEHTDEINTLSLNSPCSLYEVLNDSKVLEITINEHFAIIKNILILTFSCVNNLLIKINLLLFIYLLCLSFICLGV